MSSQRYTPEFKDEAVRQIRLGNDPLYLLQELFLAGFFVYFIKQVRQHWCMTRCPRLLSRLLSQIRDLIRVSLGALLSSQVLTFAKSLLA